MTVPILPCGGNSNTQVGKRAKKIRMEATRSAMVGKYQDADCLPAIGSVSLQGSRDKDWLPGLCLRPCKLCGFYVSIRRRIL